MDQNSPVKDLKALKSLPIVSIVVLNYNGKSLLSDCLDSLEKTNYQGDWKVWVIDNGSTDGSQTEALNRGSRFSLIELRENKGYAAGMNAGWDASRGDFVIFANNDLTFDEQWLSALMEFMTSSDDFALAMPKILDGTDRSLINAAGTSMDFTGLGYNRGIGKPDRGQYDQPEDIPYACGALLAARTKVLQELGAFDESYFIYHEDVDLSLRARLAGYKICYVPKSIVWHRHMGTTANWSRKKFLYLAEKNRLRTLLKNYPLGLLTLALPCWAFLKVIHLTYEAIQLRGHDIRGLIDAFVWNLQMLPDTLKQRRKNMSRRRVSSWQFIKTMKFYSLEIAMGLGILSHPKVRPLISFFRRSK